MRHISYVQEISKEEAVALVKKFHYSKVLPRINKMFLGGYTEEGELVAAITLGWGVRPVHTIKKLFPSLEPKDYFEIGKMVADDKMPRNTETQFLSLVEKYVKQHRPEVKVIFTWADGMLGKAGYVYQAANYMYGGYIWTDSYFTTQGEKVHPRATSRLGKKQTNRPKYADLESLGWMWYKGKQFRYVRFLCSKTEKKKLLRESAFEWQLIGAKEKDLQWKRRTDAGWQPSERPKYDPNEQSYKNALKK